MRPTGVVTVTVEVAVDPAAAFAIFTEEIDDDRLATFAGNPQNPRARVRPWWLGDENDDFCSRILFEESDSFDRRQPSDPLGEVVSSRSYGV